MSKNKIMIKTKSISLVLMIMFAFTLTTQIAFAAYKTLEKIPGVTNTDFPSYVTGIYNFAIAIVLIAALLMITLGGFYYITSAGNQAQAGTAKKIITDALLGLVVVFLIYLILDTINPDLMNSANPNLGQLQSSVQGSQLTKQEQGRAVQRDVYCRHDGTGCKNSLKECQIANGENACLRRELAIDKSKTYGTNGAGGEVTAYDSEVECLASGEIYCTSGRDYNNSLVYGTDHADKEVKLESTGTVSNIGGDLTHLSDESIAQLQSISGNEYNSLTTATLSFTETHTLHNVTITRVEDLGVGGEGKKITTSSASELELYAKSKDGLLHISRPLVVDSSGNEYYMVNDREDPLYGYIVSGSAETIILPKDDGTPYTVYELEGFGFEDASPDEE